MDIQIEGVHTDITPQWRADIEARVADLHPGHDITHVRVRLTGHDHRSPDDSHSVLIVVQIPGHTMTAEKQQGTFEEAIHDTFDAVAVELEKVREKRASHEVDVSAARAGHRHEAVSQRKLWIHCVGRRGRSLFPSECGA